MTARTGMVNLITELRSMTNAGASDYTLGSISYWTDEQLQGILDKHRTEVVNDPLKHIIEYSEGGMLNITRYYSHYGNYEQTTGGTAIFVVRDGNYNTQGTATYTPDYVRGEVIFSSSTEGLPYYLTGRSYDLNRAAVDVWSQKATSYATAVDFSTDNHNITRSQLIANCMQMVQVYRSKAKPVIASIDRSDT